MQGDQLLFFTQQKESEGEIGNEQVLQEMQETHASQRDEVTQWHRKRHGISKIQDASNK